MNDVRLAFDSMKECGIVTRNVIIGAYVESGRDEEAYRLFGSAREIDVSSNVLV